MIAQVAYFVKMAALLLGGLSLFWSFISNDSDGAKFTARMVRAVGLILLAIGLNLSFQADRASGDRQADLMNMDLAKVR